MTKIIPITYRIGVGSSNRHRVPLKQWAKWSPESRAAFNYVMDAMKDPKIITHPKTAAMPADQWYTVRWNAAWLAADAVRENEREARRHRAKRAA